MGAIFLISFGTVLPVCISMSRVLISLQPTHLKTSIVAFCVTGRRRYSDHVAQFLYTRWNIRHRGLNCSKNSRLYQYWSSEPVEYLSDFQYSSKEKDGVLWYNSFSKCFICFYKIKQCLLEASFFFNCATNPANNDRLVDRKTVILVLTIMARKHYQLTMLSTF